MRESDSQSVSTVACLQPEVVENKIMKTVADIPIRSGALIVNADDWGRDHETTDRTLDCFCRGSISSVSAMVFMEDSERAAGIARANGVEAGLHLNFTTPFTGPALSQTLVEKQQKLARYLSRHRIAHVVFHPGLANAFEYVTRAQIDEFSRLYGSEPGHIDGHHHAHLCANVVLGNLLPAGTIVRRNFSFRAGEKSLGNRLYRQMVDRKLAKRHRLTDYFFSLPPLEEKRLQRILSEARTSIVELETHPVNPSEYDFLCGQGINDIAPGLAITRGYSAFFADESRTNGNA